MVEQINTNRREDGQKSGVVDESMKNGDLDERRNEVDIDEGKETEIMDERKNGGRRKRWRWREKWQVGRW